MDENYLNDVLQNLTERQNEMKNKLGEALLKSTNEEEKKEIQKMIDFNNEIEIAIQNKDLNTLQKIYSNASNQ